MSTAQTSGGASRGMALRIIVPSQIDSDRLVAQLGPTRKFESQTIVLDSARLTTDKIAKYIREYAKLRDETFHTIRLLGIERNPRNLSQTPSNLAERLDELSKQLDEVRGEHHDLQSKSEALEKQVEDSRRKVALSRQVLEAGFGLNEVQGTKSFGFTRILGRIPTRRLQEARRALDSSLKDQSLMATGNHKGDSTYLLVAVPSDKATTALQTLVLHDFASIEVPNLDQPDLSAGLSAESMKAESAAKQLEQLKGDTETFVKTASEKLNSILDNAQESLIYLRAILRIGEGAKAQHAFTILEKSPPAKAMDALVRSGALVESE